MTESQRKSPFETLSVHHEAHAYRLALAFSSLHSGRDIDGLWSTLRFARRVGLGFLGSYLDGSAFDAFDLEEPADLTELMAAAWEHLRAIEESKADTLRHPCESCDGHGTVLSSAVHETYTGCVACSGSGIG